MENNQKLHTIYEDSKLKVREEFEKTMISLINECEIIKTLSWCQYNRGNDEGYDEQFDITDAFLYIEYDNDMIPLNIAGEPYFEYDYDSNFIDESNSNILPYSEKYDISINKLIQYVKNIKKEVYKFMYDLDFEIEINKDGTVTKRKFRY